MYLWSSCALSVPSAAGGRGVDRGRKRRARDCGEGWGKRGKKTVGMERGGERVGSKNKLNDGGRDERSGGGIVHISRAYTNRAEVSLCMN